MNILVSSCLLGCKCRYDGNLQKINIFNYLKENYCLIPFCPEQAGGLPTPRIPSEIVKGKVLNKNNIDCTKEFTNGANEALKICELFNISYAILKSKSPSCGFGEIYDGSFSGNLITGNGITGDLLYKNNIKILNENNFRDYLK